MHLKLENCEYTTMFCKSSICKKNTCYVVCVCRSRYVQTYTACSIPVLAARPFPEPKGK